MPATEQALVFECQQATLVGVLSLPAAPADTAVIVVVGGPQYRAGSHRQFVQLARSLAEAGVAVLRFDVRGMGDSDGDLRPFDQLDDDIHAAVCALRARLPQVRHVVLWGLCDGAAAVLLYLHGRPDAEVQGVCLVNPWVRSELSQARTQIKHYYLQRLLTLAFWRKLLQGGVGWSALSGMLVGLRRAFGASAGARPVLAAQAIFQDRMAAGLCDFAGDVLLLLSGGDFTAREFEEYARSSPKWRRALERARLTRQTVPDADHTFSVAAHRRVAESATLDWLLARAQARPVADPGRAQVSGT